MNCCDDGHCCSSGYSCCGNKCCHPGTTHCCDDGPPDYKYYCCLDGQACCNGHCCVTKACDECVDGLCRICGGRPYESCCNGTCYDRRAQKCCDDAESEYICDINKICCYGSCCDPTECEDCNATTHACEVCGSDTDKFCCKGNCCNIGETCCDDGHCCPEGWFCCDTGCCPDSALCSLGLSEKTDNPETLLQLGWLTFSQGEWQEAISYFEKVLEKLDDKPVDVLYSLARMYEETGNKTKAIETYLQLLSLLGDENPEIQKVEMHIILLEEKSGE